MTNDTLDPMLDSAEPVSEDLKRLNKSERGATMLEYGLLAALIAVVCIIAITFLGRRACSTFSSVGSSMAAG